MTKHIIIKTSSLGDVVHMLPAITDAARQMPDCTFDWMVERSFAEVPAWHPQVNRAIPVDLRKWRKNIFKKSTWKEVSAFRNLFKNERYTKVIDSQGLVKSAVLSRMVAGEHWGYDRKSIREPAASSFYRNKVAVPFREHAITRNRLILAKSLGYSIDDLSLDYGVAGNEVFDLVFNTLSAKIEIPKKYIVALHGTSRKDKEWPISNWHELISTVEDAGYSVFLPWGNRQERTRATLLANQHKMTRLLPKCSLTTLAGLIQKSSAVIGMDTGLMHVAAAFNKCGIALYPATELALSGVMTAMDTIESLSGAESLDVQLVSSKLFSALGNA